MAKLQDYNGHYCESDYEYAFIAFLEKENWKYLSGNKMPRNTKSDVLCVNDLEEFLSRMNPDLLSEEIRQISDNVRLVCSRGTHLFRCA